ncbi:MAG: penicillin-binding protein 2 [Desulfobacterales bacterium]|nr:MAG: penicillin-binding protein 2 [Desulfobacterales bacterium]
MRKRIIFDTVEEISEHNEEAINLLKKRVLFAIVPLIFFFVIILGRLWFLQVICGSQYKDLAENNRVRVRSVSPPRGHILDRYGREIVTNRPSFNVVMIREDSYDIEDIVKRLAGVLDENIETLWDRIRDAEGTPRHLPIIMKEDIDWNTLAFLENHKYTFPGIRIEVQPVRSFHYGDLAANTIGYIGSINRSQLQADKENFYQGGDLIGKRGLEKLREKDLRGEKGARSAEVNARGFEQQQLKNIDPLPGNDIRLTIDAELQKEAESFMAIGDKAGAIVAMEVNTGRVLVAASAPSIHLEDFVGGISLKNWKALLNNEKHPLINKVIQATYPPGSTYKVVTALAGLMEGVIDENTTIYCPGYYRLGNRVYRCWKHGGHGVVNLKRAIAESCDVYFYQVGQRVGVDGLAEYAHKFGLGKKTGIEIEHEKSGLIPTRAWKKKARKETWQEGETLSIAIGQGFNLLTPLQVCLMTATTANGGRIYKPQLIESVSTPDGTVLEQFKPKLLAEMNNREKKHLELIRDGLLEAVHGNRGTARRVRIENLTIAAKTGTAQVVRVAQYKGLKETEIPYKYRDHAWFTCYAPADDPQIAVTVLVEHGLHGASGAGPIARVVLRKYFEQYLKERAGMLQQTKRLDG